MASYKHKLVISMEGIHIKLPNAKKVEIEYLADLWVLTLCKVFDIQIALFLPHEQVS
jgi:hypothetical protein